MMNIPLPMDWSVPQPGWADTGRAKRVFVGFGDQDTIRRMKIAQSSQEEDPLYNPGDWQAMTAWFGTGLGQYLLQRERDCLQELLKRRFGYHLLQLGCAETLLHDPSPMGHKFSFCPHADAGTLHTACARGEAIPLASGSVDLVLLHHALDFSTQQHQLLREVARVLIAGGSAVIIGFNPLSTWGLRTHLPGRCNGQRPWNASLLGTRRLTDWLKLLEFQVDPPRYGGYVLPVDHPRSLRWSSRLEPLASRLHWPTGGFYLLHARKQVVPLTPVQRSWRKLPMPGIGLPLADQVGTTSHQENVPLDP
jgi:SAM-dependent methyltransferase